MSRSFTAGSSQSIDYAGVLATQRPFTVSCWFKTTTLASTQTLVSFGSGSSTVYYQLQVGTDGKIKAISANGGSGTATSSTATTTGTWTHATAVFSTGVLRAAYLNGGGKGTNATSISNVAFTNTSIGYAKLNTNVNYFDGEIGHVAIWNIPLTDAEVTSLGGGADPRTIQPAFLISYLPLQSGTTDEIGTTWTNNGTSSGSTNSDTIPAAAPTSVSAGTPSGSTCALTWTPPGGTVRGYEVDIDWTDGTFGTYVTRPVTSGSGTTIPGLLSSTQYWFRVRAWNTGGVGPNSSTVTATTGAGTTGHVYPGPAWMGRATSGGTVPADPTRTTFKPATRFADVPFQETTTDFDIPVQSFSYGGVEKVELWVGGNTIEVPYGIQDYDNELEFPAYIGLLDISEIPINGFVDVYAISTPVEGSGQARVEGPWKITVLPLGYDTNLQQIIKYVGPSGTDDATAGRGDTSGDPYLTVSFARAAIASAATRQTVGGGIIRLLTGTSYAYGAGTENTAYAAPDRWLTIQPNTGLTVADCGFSTQGSGNGLRTQHVHLKNVAWTADSTIGGPTDSTYALWIDGVEITGTGRTVSTKAVTSSGWGYVFATNSYATALQDGFRFGTNQFYRSCEVDGVVQIALGSPRLCINCHAHHTDDTGAALGDPHGDIVFGDVASNVIIYGLYTHNTSSGQGLFYKGLGGASTTYDLAFVNCQMDKVCAMEDQHFSHFMSLNCTYREPDNATSGALRFTDNVSNSLTGTYFRIERNVFENGYSEADLISVTPATRDSNLFATGSTLGTNAIADTPDWDADYVPTDGGNLLPGVAPLDEVPVDRLGNLRNSTSTALGALAADGEYIHTLTIGSETAGSWTATSVPADIGTALTFTANAGTDVLTLSGAGWTIPSGAVVRFTTSGTLPGGLTAYKDYYTERVSDTTFKVHNKPDVAGGTLVDITSTGSGTHTATLDSASAEVIARHWYCELTPNKDYTDTALVGAFAFHINGPPTARCLVNGTATVIQAWKKTVVDGQDRWAYFARLPVADTDKRVEIRWEFTPQHAGISRVLQGDPVAYNTTSGDILNREQWKHRSMLSFYVNSNASGGLPRYFAVVDPDGYVSGGAVSTSLATARTTPFQTFATAMNAFRALAQGGNGALSSLSNTSNVGGTIYLKQSTTNSNLYTFTAPTAWRYNWFAEILIDSDPTNTQQVHISTTGNVGLSSQTLRFGSGLKYRITSPNIEQFADDIAVTNHYRETYIFECSEFYDATVEALGDNWYICDHLGYGLTGASYNSSNWTITKTGGFTSYSFSAGDSIRCTDTNTDISYQFQIASKTSNDAVVIKKTGDTGIVAGFDLAPAFNITDISTTPNKYRNSSITGTNVRQIICRGMRFHHIHASAVGAAYLDNCELDHIIQGPFDPAVMFNCYLHDQGQITAINGIHMDGLQWSVSPASNPDNAAEYLDSNAIVLCCRWDIAEQPLNHSGYRRNIAVVANMFINISDGESAGHIANMMSRYTSGYHQYLNHFLWLDNIMPGNTLAFHTPTSGGITFPTVKNTLISNSVGYDNSAHYDDGTTSHDIGAGSVKTPYLVLYRNCVSKTAISESPYSGWATSNMSIVSPIGYSSLTDPALPGNYNPPAALQDDGITDIPFDAFFVERDLVGGTSIGAVAYVAESDDVIAPELANASVNTLGNELTINFTETVSGLSLDDLVFTEDDVVIDLSNLQGNGSGPYTASLDQTVYQSRTLELDYTGTSVEDLAENLLDTFTDSQVTNNSTQVFIGSPPGWIGIAAGGNVLFIGVA